ncbi:MAG: PEP-CTERM sorting domain-containing protein [Cyanobacteria bacterium P01_F01_bin.13]
MKKIVFAATALGVTAFAAPAQALNFRWDVDYTGFFAGGSSITGSFIADEAAATDGFVSTDEFDSWVWNFSGNGDVSALSISSDEDGEIQTFPGIDITGFFVDGTANVPGDDAFEGVYASDTAVIDLDFLTVEDLAAGNPFSGGPFTSGDVTVSEAIAVADPEVVPEPATLLGLLTLAGAAAMAKRQKHAA